MKNMTYSMAAAGAAILISAAGASAEDWTDNLYLNAAGGGIFQQNADFTESGFRTVTAEFNPGIRVDLGVGYKLNDSLAVELESGVLWNSVDTLAGFPLRSGASIDMYHLPMLAKVVYNFKTDTALTPYVSAGAGANFGLFDGKLPGSSDRDMDVGFAFQGEAGLKYAVSENSSVGVAYKFYGTTDQDYDINVGGGTDHISFGGVYIHAIMINFTLSF